MKKLLIYLFLLAHFTNVSAQASLGKQIQNAKFQIVKKTVEFLSTDKLTFGNKTNITCAGCTDDKAVKEFAAANKLTKVDMLVDELEKMPVDTSAEKWRSSLAGFKESVVAKITSGEKVKRKNLATYPGYESSLHTIISNIHTAEDKSANTPETAKTNKKDTNNIDTSAAGNTVLHNAAAPGATNDLMSAVMLWLPYIVAAALLGLLIYSSSNNAKTKQRKAYYKEKTKKLADEISENKKAIFALTAECKNLKKKLTDSELDIKTLEDRLRSAEKKTQPSQPLEKQKAAPLAAPEKQAAKPIVQPLPKTPAATIKYARYADTGDGFSNAELLDNPDDETIFELSIAAGNNTGEYKIVHHAGAQQYALSNAQYFLGKTCQYDSLPAENATIRTETPGTIKLSGGKWTIVTPAKISFS